MDDTQDETVEATEVSRDNTLAFKITADGKIMLNDSPADTTSPRSTSIDVVTRKNVSNMNEMSAVDVVFSSGIECFLRFMSIMF